MPLLTRRTTLTAGAGLALAGCSRITDADKLTASQAFQHVLAHAEGWTLAAQRFLLQLG